MYIYRTTFFLPASPSPLHVLPLAPPGRWAFPAAFDGPDGLWRQVRRAAGLGSGGELGGDLGLPGRRVPRPEGLEGLAVGGGACGAWGAVWGGACSDFCVSEATARICCPPTFFGGDRK